MASHPIESRVGAVLSDAPRVLLAVSGGLDSMVLMHAAVRSTDGRRLSVATFDHGTGEAATRAVAAVKAACEQLGVAAVVGSATPQRPATEEAWRNARWEFLNTEASVRQAAVATAHTRDDQIETVLMRLLRGAGARGLAGLEASSRVLRPLLPFSRAEVLAYAKERRIAWIEDPTNASLVFLRNRIRHEILPALRAAQPDIHKLLLETGHAAAHWRSEVEQAVSSLVPVGEAAESGDSMDVATTLLAGHGREALCVVWPVLLDRIGVVADRRAIDRLADFTLRSRVGSKMQISGGWEMVRSRTHVQARRRDRKSPSAMSLGADTVHWGRWTFRHVEDAGADAWSAVLPRDEPLSIRSWRPGDRLDRVSAQPKKVKEVLSKAGITGVEREEWPVVLAGDRIVWIPGVSRERRGRGQPSGLAFQCEPPGTGPRVLSHTRS